MGSQLTAAFQNFALDHSSLSGFPQSQPSCSSGMQRSFKMWLHSEKKLHKSDTSSPQTSSPCCCESLSEQKHKHMFLLLRPTWCQCNSGKAQEGLAELVLSSQNKQPCSPHGNQTVSFPHNTLCSDKSLLQVGEQRLQGPGGVFKDEE